MPTKFICLANSFKEGGRCLAGIELDASNNPVFKNGRPKWIRPVCDTAHGEIPNHVAEPFQILNIIEIDVTGNRPEGYQSENITFNKDSIRSIGDFSKDKLTNLGDGKNVIFGNKGKAVSQDAIVNLDYSLMFVNINQFEVTHRVYEDRPDRPQTRLVFKYNGNHYDFPVTDPVFLLGYQKNPDLLEGINQVYLSLSLGVVWEDWYYKLVAAIIF
ncbi:MAG: hypothetical protein ABI723_12000 [Bacteroidia bacterium]